MFFNPPLRVQFSRSVVSDSLQPLRVMKIKTKINKWDLTKKLLHSKGSINKMKRQPSEWEKVYANEATYKRLISKIHKELV